MIAILHLLNDVSMNREAYEEMSNREAYEGRSRRGCAEN